MFSMHAYFVNNGYLIYVKGRFNYTMIIYCNLILKISHAVNTNISLV